MPVLIVMTGSSRQPQPTPSAGGRGDLLHMEHVGVRLLKASIRETATEPEHVSARRQSIRQIHPEADAGCVVTTGFDAEDASPGFDSPCEGSGRDPVALQILSVQLGEGRAAAAAQQSIEEISGTRSERPRVWWGEAGAAECVDDREENRCVTRGGARAPHRLRRDRSSKKERPFAETSVAPFPSRIRAFQRAGTHRHHPVPPACGQQPQSMPR